MLFNEWSLVIFTILVQTAIGMLLVSEVARVISPSSVSKSFSWQLPTISLVTGASLLFSLGHLGTPMHSVYTILNAGSSWLSREILATGGFFVSVVALAVIRMKSPEAKATGVSVAASILGLVTVFVMSRVYMLQTVPVWDSISTMLGFYGTMLILGSIAGGVLFGIQTNKGDELKKGDHIRIAGAFIVAAILGLGLKFIGIPLDMISLDATNNLGVSGIDILTSGGTFLFVACVALTFLGTAVFAWGIYKIIASNEMSAMTNLSLCAFGLVLAGEIVARLMFYGTYLRIGL
ncbi:DMSO reductase subunit C [Pseudodesulfovibrio nedwellii]|uniref:DMSO reductase subunit C n=1 Tax=Pseudodesulfovibrio nedwellii TaxID=2973072 RepID=A0ABM8AW98_9BACT|nr:DmsC/YnfH family molybdoenzyme membrane anchor subunit [Pseudodesulfovibrio nedwellii]BDQ35737.1 DMSO reductase subunit C [Pseudodesulfovibrio nedwellii]